MNKPITDKDHAYENVIKAIRLLGNTIQNTIPINKGRYKIIKTNKQTFLYIYKEETLGTFNKISDKNTVGETINKDDFETAVRRGCQLIIRTTKTGNILIATMKDFYYSSHTWINKEKKEVYSAPIDVFKGFNEVLT